LPRLIIFGIGSNEDGLLGLGPTIADADSLIQIKGELERANVLQLKAGGMHSVCLTETGKVRKYSRALLRE
jgi:alpha-tubulin suppressor-like RCC1 family protein